MRLCEYVGIPSLFQGRVMGVGKSADGDVTFEKEISLADVVNRIKGPIPNPTPGTGVNAPEAEDWFVKKQKEAADAQNEAQKKLKDAESWRSNTPIFSWTTTSPSGDPRTVKVYGYNKELKAVWVAEGPSASAGNSMLISEAFLASKSPEWVAWKSGSTSGLSLPLLLGAAYLLLA